MSIKESMSIPGAPASKPKDRSPWLFDLLLIVVLIGAAAFRFMGSNWGELNIQHPDEDFMTSVTYDIAPVQTLGQYFNTATSTLNPYNRGYSFYVYGDLPLILTRYLADWTQQLNNVRQFGREISAAMDLLTVALLYFLAKRLYGSRTAILAALFSACAVMEIQQSHFYTSDNFVTFFMLLTLYVAVVIATGSWQQLPDQDLRPVWRYLRRMLQDPLALLSLAFGLVLGMAAACKVNAAVLAVALPVALLIRYFRTPGEIRRRGWNSDPDFPPRLLAYLVLGGLASILSFRIFQPYAFIGLRINPQFLSNLAEVRSQSSPLADLPWALQWADRSHLFSLHNMVIWGLGLPLGLLAVAGFLWMGWRILKGEWQTHLLVWLYTGLYVLWQSLQFNPTMRYELPVYPTMALLAAWLVIWLWDRGSAGLDRKPWPRLLHILSVVIGGGRGRPDHLLGDRLHRNLHPSRAAHGRFGLDLPEHPRADQPAHPDPHGKRGQ